VDLVAGGTHKWSTNTNLVHIDGPGLGPGPGNRSGSLIKLWSLRFKITVNLVKDGNQEWVGGSVPWVLHIIQQRNPHGAIPKVTDVFQLPGMDSDTSCDLNAMMKPDEMHDFKIVRTFSGNLNPPVKGSAGNDRVWFDAYVKFFKRGTIYQEFHKDKATGGYQDMKKNSYWAILNAHSPTNCQYVVADMKCRQKFFH